MGQNQAADTSSSRSVVIKLKLKFSEDSVCIILKCLVSFIYFEKKLETTAYHLTELGG